MRYVGLNPIDRVTMELTWKCQDKCAWCHNPPGPEAAEDKLGFSRVRQRVDELPRSRWLELASQVAELRPRMVDISGGEPLLVRYVEDVVSLLTGESIPVKVITNGDLLERKLPSLVASGLSAVQMSLHGASAEINDAVTGRKGSFDRKMQGGRALRAHIAQPGLVINMVVEPRNYFDIAGVAALADEFGARVLVFEKVFLRGHAEGRAHFSLSKSEQEAAWEAVRRVVDTYPHIRVLTRTLMADGQPEPLACPNEFVINPAGYIKEFE